jgi:plasmid stabilization system protein ParE
MSVYSVKWTRAAAEELTAISQWIAKRNPPAAARWLEATESHVLTLKEFPERCSIAPEAKDCGSTVRQLVVGKRRGRYRVLFRVWHNEVQILQIIHGMRDMLTPEEFDEVAW